MHERRKIPVVIGITGHRNLVEEDKPTLKARVIESLKEIQKHCKSKEKGGEDTPIVMLNGFAQGADMLCAEAAFELGIDVYAVLPCEKEKYIKSFDDENDKNKLEEYLSVAKRQFVAPDTEKNKAWIKKTASIDDESYEYRQVGIYLAEHSHILIALWDGKPPKGEFGCGTVEVINFALEHKFLDRDKLFKPGMINDSAVVWIKSRRQGDGSQADIQKKWLISNLAEDDGERYGDYLVSDELPAFLKDIISKTVEYNAESVDASSQSVKLWENVDELDEYRSELQRHYIKANALSYDKNQKKYNRFIFWIAFIGTVVAGAFLIYDDASLPFMIFPCTVAICALIGLTVRGKRKFYHKKYIDYRALSEALRIQFYMTMCLGGGASDNVCDLYAWSQKVDMVWVEKTIRSLSVIGRSEKIKADATRVIEAWIGDRENGQLKYQRTKKEINRKKAKKYARLSAILQIMTIAVYFLIFIFEVVALIAGRLKFGWFWQDNIIAHVSWRNFGAIVLGVFTCGSLLFSSFWGKLSFERKADDNVKMSNFYASAYAKWKEVKEHHAEVEKFVKEIAREELLENGVWYSYVSENKLELNI